LKIISLLMKKTQETEKNKAQIFNEILRLMKNIVDQKENSTNLN
jgi:hypothetical protein